MRRADRRRMSSRSSVGRVAGVFAGGLDFDAALVVGVARSRLLRALRRRRAFAARIRAVLRDYDLVRRDKRGRGGCTSVTASSSFCAGWFLVEPFGFRILFASVA